jgi:hypothetical protein
MSATEKSLSKLLARSAIAVAAFVGRILFLLFVIVVGGAGILFAEVRLEYDLKYEGIASPILHYLALLSVTLVPVAILLTAISRTRETNVLTLAVSAMLLAFALLDGPGVIAIPVYLVGIYCLVQRLRKPLASRQ